MSTYCYYLEGGGDAVALFVEDKSSILHTAGSEEADVTRPGEFLRCFASIVIGWGDSADWADDVEMIGDQGFVGDEKEEGEFLEDSDLCDFGIDDYL